MQMDFRRSAFCPCLLLLILGCWLGWTFVAQAETPTVSDRPLMCKPSPDALCAVILSSGQSVVGRLVAVQPGENLRIQTLQGTERTVPWQEFIRAIPVSAGADFSTQSTSAAAVQTKVSPHEDVKITAGHAESPSMTCEVNSSEQCRVLLRDGTELIGGLVRLVRGERLLIKSPDNALREVQWESLLSAKPIQNTARMDATCEANATSVCMVMLRDGSVIVGKLVRLAQGDRVLIKSADGMLREVQWASLLSMSSVRQTATPPAVAAPKRVIVEHDGPVSPRAEAAVVSVANLHRDMSIDLRFRRGDNGDNGSTHWLEACAYPCSRLPMYWNSKYRVVQQDGTLTHPPIFSASVC
jgi:small nuclear ribonucleoprotein (snRNP)-like protein